MMNTLLSQFGLSENEQAVMVALLRRGASTVLEISRFTQVKRPTVYLALESLINSGLVSKKLIGRRAIFQSVPREVLPSTLIERARVRLHLQERAAAELTEALEALGPQRPQEVGGLLVESLASERGLYREMYENLLRGDYVGIFNPQLAVNSSSKHLLVDFLKKTGKSQPRIREIAVAGPQCDWYRAQIRNTKHELREMPPKTEYITDLILTDGMLVLLDYSPRTRAAVKIRQPNLYRSFLSIFEELWGRLG